MTSVSSLEDGMSRLEERVGKLEERVFRVEEAINALRERVARVEGIVEQMDKRLNHIEAELRGLREEFVAFRKEVFDGISSLRGEVFSEIASVRKEILELRRDLNTRFYWLIGIQISMWVTIILTILFRAH